MLLAGAAVLAQGIGPAGLASRQAGQRKPALASSPADQKQQVRAERYEIDVAFEPEKGSLRARAAVTLRARESLEAIEFELNPRLEIQEITDAQGRKLTFDRSRRLGSPKLLVRLAEPCPAEQGITLTFTYWGTLPAGQLDYITKEGILLRDESRWYPGVDFAAFTLNEIRVRLPAYLEALTSGELQGRQSSAGFVTYHWKTSRAVSSRSISAYPTRLGSLGPGPRGSDPSAANVPLVQEICRSPSSAEPSLTCGRLAEKALGLIEKYSRGLGPFPHPRMTIVPGFPGAQGALGYSAPGFLVVSPDVLKWHDAPGYAPEFLPHEIAHQWFPIEVTLERQEDGWLAESLAEYLAWRHLLESSPAEARAMVAQDMRDALEPEPLRPLALGLRLFGLEDWDVTHATLYQRGMLVFRTLETVIGRARVDAALREFYKRHAGRTGSIAAFRKICEEISGRDLGWFFDYFLEGTRIPEIELRRVPSPVPGEVAGEIVVRNVPPEFTVRVEMRLHTTQGPVDHSVATRGEVTPFTVTLPGQVTGITLDPDARILRWTEAARRHPAQRELLAELGKLERAGKFVAALEACRKALDADPENLAANHQQIWFARGRLHYRLGHYQQARREFGRALELASLDRSTTDFYRAWSRVYRARIARAQGNLRAARAEAKAGLAINAPALHTAVSWPEAPRRTSTALVELRALAR